MLFHAFDLRAWLLPVAARVLLLLAAALAFPTAHAQSIIEISGTVEIRADANAPWRVAAAGETLAVGGSLRTLQGEAHLELPEGLVRLAADSELTRLPRGLALRRGRAFAVGERLLFQLAGPVTVNGEARFDALPEIGERVAVVAGSARVTAGGRVLDLEAGQQLFAEPGGGAEVVPFVERDPWYRDRIVIEGAHARVFGFLGSGELRDPDGTWRAASRDATIAPGYAVRTGADSWLELRFDEGSLLRLQADTEIAWRSAEVLPDEPTAGPTRRTVVTLERGKVWAVVEGGNGFEIEAPGLVAGVRGTTFRLDAVADPGAPQLKTFEGEVLGFVGFTVVEVDAGSQFAPDVGVEPLTLDELDSFNLERDRLLAVPELTLAPLPSAQPGPTVTLRGTVDAGSLVRSGRTQLRANDGVFTLQVPLRRGFNLVTVEARLEEGGTPAVRVLPLVSERGAAFVALAAPQLRAGGVSLTGVAAPGTTITASGRTDAGRQVARSAIAGDDGRFRLHLPGVGSGDIDVMAVDPLGDERSEQLRLEP